MTDSKPTIGFIGLGIMGKPMARNLMAAGYGLIVLDIVSEAVDDLVTEGAVAGLPRHRSRLPLTCSSRCCRTRRR